MAWEYLLTDTFDHRAMLIAGYLASKIEGMYIVDIDCGHAPLLKYLPETYMSYKGNDILSERLPQNTEKAQFFPLSDDLFVKQVRSCDILVAMGIGGYELTNEGIESQTITQSILTLVETHQPEIVVLEAIVEHVQVLDLIRNSIPYTLKHKVYLSHEVSPTSRVNHRVVQFLHIT